VLGRKVGSSSVVVRPLTGRSKSKASTTVQCFKTSIDCPSALACCNMYSFNHCPASAPKVTPDQLSHTAFVPGVIAKVGLTYLFVC
jgi:hypothetical protein